MTPALYQAMGSDPEKLKGVTLPKGITRRVIGLARPYRTSLFGFLAVIVAAAALDLVPPLVFRQIIDHTLPDKDVGQLTLLGLVVVGVALINAVLSFFERWTSSRIGEGLIFDLRTRLFDHVQRMPISFFTRTQTGALVSRMNNDVIGAQRALTATLGSLVSNAIVLVTTLTAMLLLEWRLTVLALVLLPVFVVPAKRVGRRLQAITREGMDLNAQMNTTMTERFNVAGALLVKLFGRSGDERDAFAVRAARVRDIGVRSAMYSRTFFIALGLVASVGAAVVYWVGGRLVIDEQISAGTLVAMAAFVTRIYTPLTALSNTRVDVMTALVSFDRVFEVLDAPNPLADAEGAEALSAPRGHIELDHVWFRYSEDAESSVASLEGRAPNATPSGEAPWVLRDVSVDIAPGSLVALVGPSGAGKTTFSSLVPRLYDVTEGTVRFDGHDVRFLQQESLRSAIGVVSQDPHLFHDTILENLRYARPDADAPTIEDACRAAQIHDLIVSLPDGYDTVVGERGYRLSGGEKQRLAIARMLLKDPAVVILDEATSHLDSENEVLVQRALAAALDGRTSIVIAHRLSTITDADLILVLDEGEIVERGRHADLLHADGVYANLFALLQRDAPAASPARL